MSALAVYFLLQQVSIEELRLILTRAQPLPLVVLIATVVASLLTRAARWQVFFLPHRHIPYRPLLETLSISYMASTFLPLRAGELIRALLLGQRAAVSVPRVVGTIVLEKLFDFLAIGVMLVLLMMIAPLPGPAMVASVSIASVILLGFGFVVALAVWREPSLWILRVVDARLPTAITSRVRLEQAARQFAEGTDSLRSLRLWVPLVGWTAVTWVCSVMSGWAGVVALNQQPTLPMLLFLSVLTSTGQAVPSSPGYVGVYHAAATIALTAFGIDLPTALAIAVVIHAFSYGTLVIAGLIALWTGGYTFGDVLSGVQGRKSTAPNPAVVLAPER